MEESGCAYLQKMSTVEEYSMYVGEMTTEGMADGC